MTIPPLSFVGLSRLFRRSPFRVYGSPGRREGSSLSAYSLG